MVIGTYKKKTNNGDGEEAQKEIYIPFTTFGQAFNRGDRVGWMAITAEDGYSITDLKESIFTVVKERHKIHPEDNRAIGNFDLYQEFSKINKLFIALKGVAYFVGILVLLSGIIGISNIMLIVVKERTKEIGIRRALRCDSLECKMANFIRILVPDNYFRNGRNCSFNRSHLYSKYIIRSNAAI